MTRVTSSVSVFLALWLMASDGGVLNAGAPNGASAPPELAGDVVASAADPHDYFDSLCSRADTWKCFSLRSPEQLAAPANGGYAHSNNRALVVVYDATMDAAKITIPTTTNSLSNQVRLPMGTSTSQSYLITWDAWFGPEWRYDNTGIDNYKTWQFTDAGNAIWTEMQSRFLPMSRDRKYEPSSIGTGVYMAATRHYKAAGPNVTDSAAGEPRVRNFVVEPSTWTRYWVLFEPCGSYLCYSLWLADERQAPTLIQDRLQFHPTAIDMFWIEYNTSHNPISARGSLVSYNRNVAMLRGVTYSQVSGLLQRPGASTTLPPPTLPIPAPPTNVRIIR